MQLVQQVINPWKRVRVLDGHIVQLAIVNTHLERIILLLYKKDRSAIRRGARLYETFF